MSHRSDLGMSIPMLLMGGAGLVLSGNAITRFKDTKDARFLTMGVAEIFASSYFIIASIGSACA